MIKRTVCNDNELRMRWPQWTGYIRILEQEEKDRALRDKVLEMLEDERTLFVDIRNKDYTRPAYERMCDMIQPGDVIYIDELDSLGRTYEDH